jgi:aryl-alcohol dehydrogenase-like predicted oxidoreductase
MVPVPAKGVEQIVLGTVQMGVPYGRRAQGRAPDHSHCFRVWDAAWEHGIRCFDTAEAYGEAAHRLSEWIDSSGVAALCHVVTKVPVGCESSWAAVERAVARFPSIASCTVMTHGAVALASFAAFRQSVTCCGAMAGASVYEAHELLCMAEAGAQRIQAPVNVFDVRQRNAARGCGVPFDGRSVFLQGVLLESPEQAEARAPGTGRMAQAVQRAAMAAAISPATALIGWALQELDTQDRVVVGVDQPEELDAIVSAVTVEVSAMSDFACALAHEVGSWRPDDRSLDPRKWRSA